ncbi:MAG: hypothetical protein ACPGYL_13380, partial [Rhodospirillaceae bacterium]
MPNRPALAQNHDQDTNQDGPDWLTAEQGGMVLSVSSQLDFDANSALSLITGHTDSIWLSEPGATADQSFLFELARPVLLETLVLDSTSLADPSQGPRQISLSVSTNSQDGPFTPVLSAEAQKDARTVLALPNPTLARWLRLDITNNWGASDYVALSEVEAYGPPSGDPPPAPTTAVTGSYASNFNGLYLHQTGTDLLGCYDWDSGVVQG